LIFQEELIPQWNLFLAEIDFSCMHIYKGYTLTEREGICTIVDEKYIPVAKIEVLWTWLMLM
jgi:hypothetical protein